MDNCQLLHILVQAGMQHQPLRHKLSPFLVSREPLPREGSSIRRGPLSPRRHELSPLQMKCFNQQSEMHLQKSDQTFVSSMVLPSGHSHKCRGKLHSD